MTVISSRAASNNQPARSQRAQCDRVCNGNRPVTASRCPDYGRQRRTGSTGSGARRHRITVSITARTGDR